MKSASCQYAIIRFMPFVETGEFANVGIVLMAPAQRYFGFKLLRTQRYARITGFFEQLDRRVYQATLQDLRAELDRIAALLERHGFDKRLRSHDIEFARRLFAEVIRPRETIIRFGEPRVVLATNPEETLEELFAHYVERSFVTRQYQETILENQVRKLLTRAQLAGRFRPGQVGDDEYRVKFPFIESHDEYPTRAIKPLSLTQDDSSRILEHGGKWNFRIRELKKRHILPQRVLFAVQGPDAQGARDNAYREVVDMLADTGVDVASHQDQDRILEFARPD